MSKRVAIVFSLVSLVLMGAESAFAQSSKAAWTFDELIDLASAAAADPANPAPKPDDTGWVTVLTTHIKTPNAKELGIGVSLQCGLVTDTTVRSKGGDSLAHRRYRSRPSTT